MQLVSQSTEEMSIRWIWTPIEVKVSWLHMAEYYKTRHDDMLKAKGFHFFIFSYVKIVNRYQDIATTHSNLPRASYSWFFINIGTRDLKLFAFCTKPLVFIILLQSKRLLKESVPLHTSAHECSGFTVRELHNGTQKSSTHWIYQPPKIKKLGACGLVLAVYAICL